MDTTEFIPNHSTIVAPLINLTKDGDPMNVRWLSKEAAFQQLKDAPKSKPDMRQLLLDAEFILRAYASKSVFRAGILPAHIAKQFPTHYATMMLNEHERIYRPLKKNSYPLYCQ